MLEAVLFILLTALLGALAPVGLLGVAYAALASLWSLFRRRTFDPAPTRKALRAAVFTQVAFLAVGGPLIGYLFGANLGFGFPAFAAVLALVLGLIVFILQLIRQTRRSRQVTRLGPAAAED